MPTGSSGISSPGPSRIVDIHCHRECAEAREMMAAVVEREGRMPLLFGSELSKEVNRRQLATIRPKMDSLETRIADMDEMGVEVQALCVSPYQMYYWADVEVGRKVSRIVNDDLAEAVATYPDRLVGLGTVPLQDTDAAISELDRCVTELGFPGIEIATNVEGEDLSSSRLDPFWAAVAGHDIAVFIHPIGFTQPDRFDHHYFFNVLGHPLENTLAIANLIFGGVLERYQELKIVVAHGGGYLPAYAGRMDHAYHAREDVREGLPQPPGTYLKKVHFDTMVFEPDQLGFLIEKYGAERILLGTDYPYDMGETDPLGLVDQVASLDETQRKLITGGNAMRLLGMT